MKFMNHSKEMYEEYKERLELVSERLAEIVEAPEVAAPFDAYFKKVASFLLLEKDIAEHVLADPMYTNGENGKALNKKVYDDEIGKEVYETSFLNPTYAVSVLGKDYGACYAALYTRIRNRMNRIYAGDVSSITEFAELLVELYVAMLEEDFTADQAKSIVSSFWHDNLTTMDAHDAYYRWSKDADLDNNIMMESDLSNTDFMYRYGCYIGENEIGIFNFLKSLPESELQAMADTFTEGFRIGFINERKPLDKKEFCDIIYPIGFEPMVRLAYHNFEKMGLKANAMSFSTDLNKQYLNDHEKDAALWIDKAFVERADESCKKALEPYKDWTPKYAGPAVIETFGETPFEPESREANLKFDEKQSMLYNQMRGMLMQTMQEAIHGDERSFTIISFPIPEIGDKFNEIFAETVKVNTLDYKKYQTMQQKIIDILDTADYVHVLGSGDNKTDIKVKVYDLKDPSKETAFENCVADVNIPVGEVFTSPVLTGTNGKLHVTQVYLEGRNYLNLEMDFKDGMITDYTCSNFGDDEEANKRYIRNHVLFDHPSLPIGEFAIGTNTTAYRMGIEYDIQAKLPILIAEKTGPHFAVGDTCYFYSEDNETFNPDGKKIVARDNECSILRKEDPMKAYFNCHTDITIPYNELKSIIAVAKDGSELPIIIDGRFVVPGTEELNIPLEGLL